MKKALINYRIDSNSDGWRGYCVESALKDALGYDDITPSPSHCVDVRISVDGSHLNKVEVKTNGGNFRNDMSGNSYVIYIPVPDMNQPIDRQEGFVIARKAFIQVLKETKSYNGSRVINGITYSAVQSPWNWAHNKPNSKKRFSALLDALYDNCTMTLEELLQGI